MVPCLKYAQLRPYNTQEEALMRPTVLQALNQMIQQLALSVTAKDTKKSKREPAKVKVAGKK